MALSMNERARNYQRRKAAEFKLLSPEEQEAIRAKRREYAKTCYERNIEERREHNRLLAAERRRQQALAEGREPGRHIATPEEKAARKAVKRAKKQAYDAARYEEAGDKKRAQASAWYAENRERAIAKANAHYYLKRAEILAGEAAKRRAAIEADPTYLEKENAQSRKQYAANPQKYRALGKRAHRRWMERHPGRLAEQMRRRYWSNPEKARARAIADVARRRARKLAAGGDFTAADVHNLFEKQKGKCFVCLTPFGDKRPHVDHYLSLARGGTNDPSNLRLLCRKCNMSKHAKDPIEFGRENGLLCW